MMMMMMMWLTDEHGLTEWLLRWLLIHALVQSWQIRDFDLWGAGGWATKAYDSITGRRYYEGWDMGLRQCPLLRFFFNFWFYNCIYCICWSIWCILGAILILSILSATLLNSTWQRATSGVLGRGMAPLPHPQIRLCSQCFADTWPRDRGWKISGASLCKWIKIPSPVSASSIASGIYVYSWNYTSTSQRCRN